MAQVQESLEEQQEVMASNDPAYEAWFRRKVEAGEKAYREGRIISQEEAARRAELRREKLLKLVGR